MSRSPLKRLLICLCVLSLSVVAIAPRPAQAQYPNIWEWLKLGMRIGGAAGELKNMDVDWWVSHAGMATTNFAYRTIAGCDHDTLLWCAAQEPPFPTVESVNDGEPNCNPCNPAGDTTTGFMPGGAFGYTSLAFQEISELNSPFSLTLYAQNLKSNSLLGGDVYAGPEEDFLSGLSGFYQATFQQAVLVFWKEIRNLAYLLFVLVLIAMGFMVMLRYQVSPRVTVTVTSALPKIAIGLVLITFSYPIVSLAVDLIFPLTAVARNIVLGIWTKMDIHGIIPLPGSYAGLTTRFLSSLSMIFGGINLFSVFLFLAIIVLFLLTHILALWEFLKRFVRLIVMGIFGPLLIAWGTLPGNEDTITDWFKGLAASILALPSIILVMYAGLLILMVDPPTPTALPLPFSFGASLVSRSITVFIGLSILWKAHKVPGLIDEAFSGGNKR